MPNKFLIPFTARPIFRIFAGIFFVLLSAVSCFGQVQTSDAVINKSTGTSGAQLMEWMVNGVTRKALVYVPVTALTKATPIIFAYHGHGGTMENMYKTRGFEKIWPDAIFVCPQGLNTPGTLLDQEGRESGWLMNTDDENRDLLFFDSMYKSLVAKYKVDPKKVFVAGHSNGGGFSYLLMAKRGDLISAIAPSASTGGKFFNLFKPKPVFHIMGENDDLVKPQWQRLTCNRLLKLNECKPTGEKIAEYTTLYPSAKGCSVQLMIHPGGHKYPMEANQLIIDFFKKIN